MEGNSYKRQVITAQYLFAEDIVKAAIEMRTIEKDSSVKIQLGNTFITKTRRKQIKEFFSKECLRLDAHVRKYTSRDGRSDYSNHQFSLCVSPFIKEYRPEHKSEEEFLFICSEISYVAAYFLKKNVHSNVINVAVDQAYEMLIETFYTSLVIKRQRLLKDISDRIYRFAYQLIKTLVELRGIPVPKLQLPNSDNFNFPFNHKEKIKELFNNEWAVLDRIVLSSTLKNGKNDFSDETLAQCMDEIIQKQYGLVKNTDEELLQVSSRVAYVAAAFPSENRSNAIQLAVDRIYQMMKTTSHYKKYERDDDYRFSCDLVKEISQMRSNSLSVVEMSNSGNSFFMIAHRNKIEEIISKQKPELDEIVRNITNKSESSGSSIEQFLLFMQKAICVYKNERTSTEEIVLVCTKIAYVAACLSRNSNAANTPGLAVECMLEVIKNIKRFTNCKEGISIHTKDNHYRFSYGLVKSILQIMNVHVSDKNLPDSYNLILAAAQINKIEKVFLKERTQLDKSVEKLTENFKVLDYNDGNFLQLMFKILKDKQWYQKTEQEFMYVCIQIAYMSTFFLKKNINSNAPFLAVNRIYEMIKEKNSFKGLDEHQVLIAKKQDKHYRFAYDVTRTVLEIKQIPISTLDFPILGDIILTDKHKNKIEMLLLNERFLLDEMAEKLASSAGLSNYSDNKFIHCMDKIVEDYKSDEDTEEGLLKNCSRITYIAAGFLEKNYKSNATVLAINRMYEMCKTTYHYNRRIEEERIKDDYQFAYDLVKAAFEIRTKISFKGKNTHSAEAESIISQRNEIEMFLSKEWPRLHGIVRKTIAKHDSSDFCD